MVPLYIVLIVFSYLKPSETTFLLGDVSDEMTNVQKRETQKIDFILEKLIQHTQALEHLMKIIDESEQMLKKIVEFISTKLEQPQMPEKIEVLTPSRRSFTVENDVPEPPIVKFGENMLRYGSLMKNLILKELKNEPEPIVYIEKNISRIRRNIA